MPITQNDILTQLDGLKNKRRDYLKPKEYKSFMPSAIPNVHEPADTGVFKARIQSAMDQSNAATQTEMIKAQNQREYEQMLAAQQRLQRAKSALGSAQNYNVPFNPGSGGNTSSGGLGAPIKAGSGFRDNTPFDPNAGLATRQWNGRSLTLNRSVMNNFVGFLKALNKTGYNIESVGTYANRNIAGTNTPSLHKYGLAMDINPAQNPVSYGHVVTNMPRGIGRLARRYGLTWGGNWNGPKYDAMHFSVPYNGTK